MRYAIALTVGFVLTGCSKPGPSTPDGGGTVIHTGKNVNECADGTATCSASADCTDLPDGYYCQCSTGWQGSGVTCQPVVSVTQQPAAFIHTATTSVSFACTGGAVCTFECRLQPADFAPCTSPQSLQGLTEGQKTFDVRATDQHGGVGTASVSFTVDFTPPALNTAAFVSYDELDLTFSEAIDPASVQAAHFQITPGPSNLQVVSASVQSPTLVRLVVSPYSLPVQYTVQANVNDLAGNASAATPVNIPAAGSRSRAIFVSDTTINGDIKDWTPPGSFSCALATGLGRADCICQYEATQAGFSGTFQALLPDSNSDIYCRARGLLGTQGASSVTQSCGVAKGQLPVTGPWVRRDGFPVLPLPLTEDISDVYSEFTSSIPFTSTGPGTNLVTWGGVGSPSINCSDWTTTAPPTTIQNDQRVDYSNLSTVVPTRIGFNTLCTNALHLLCAQMDTNGFTVGTRYKHSGKRVFVTSSLSYGNLQHPSGVTGLAAADATCQDAASAAGLSNAANFIAWLSDSNNDAYCRAAGLSGKRASNCGAGQLPNVTGPYVSTAGTVLAADLAELADHTRGPHEPFVGDASGNPVSKQVAWTGTDADGVATAKNCKDWTAGTSPDTGEEGVPVDLTQWTTGGANSCGVQLALICLER